MSTQLHTEISNDLTCDTFISRVILAKLDHKYLSKQRSDVEYSVHLAPQQAAEFNIWQYRRKEFKEAEVESPAREDP